MTSHDAMSKHKGGFGVADFTAHGFKLAYYSTCKFGGADASAASVFIRAKVTFSD
jgi:hypothetical protein